MQEGVRKPRDGTGRHRQTWIWKDKGSKKGNTEDLTGDIDLAALESSFDWKTYYEPDPDAPPWPEPIAGQGGSSSSGAASSAWLGPEPPSQDRMRQAFAQERMVGKQQAVTRRQKRARRQQLRDSGYRIFTSDLQGADSFRCQLVIKPCISGSCCFCQSARFLFCTYFFKASFGGH